MACAAWASRMAPSAAASRLRRSETSLTQPCVVRSGVEDRARQAATQAHDVLSTCPTPTSTSTLRRRSSALSLSCRRWTAASKSLFFFDSASICARELRSRLSHLAVRSTRRASSCCGKVAASGGVRVLHAGAVLPTAPLHAYSNNVRGLGLHSSANAFDLTPSLHLDGFQICRPE